MAQVAEDGVVIYEGALPDGGVITAGITYLVEENGKGVFTVIEKSTGASLTWAYILLSTVSGLLAMRFANVLLNTAKVKRDFKKLIEAYADPRFWSAMLEVETYRIFCEQTNKSRKKKKD